MLNFSIYWESKYCSDSSIGISENEKKNAKAAKTIINYFKQLASFLIDLKVVEFSSLIADISDVSMVACEFDL